MSAETAMLKARAQLLMDHPFFGTLALRLKLLSKPDECSTAATDGKRLIYNPDYIMKQSAMELRGLTAHEVMHCTGNHHTRRGDRDPKLWNMACDYAINPLVVKSGLVLPEGALLDDKYDDKWSAEAIYTDLKQRQDDGESLQECKWGIVLDADNGSLTKESNAQQEADWQIAVTQAAEQAKSRGKLPGHLSQFIEDIVSPKVNWLTVLWPFFTNLTTNDYSWARPNRAYLSEDEYVPSLRSEGCGKVGLIFDTSGSTSRDQQQFVGELNSIIKDVRPESVVVVHADYEVQQTFELDQDSTLGEEHLDLKGQGGTQFLPAFEWMDENHQDVDAIVYLTDLETDAQDFAESERVVQCPVLWVSTNHSLHAPFGETVYLPH